MLTVIQHVRRLRGGSQSQLVRANDENLYVVKFRNNPQHPRVLVHEWFAARIAGRLGLRVAPVAVIDVDPYLAMHTPEMRIEVPQGNVACAEGLNLAVEYALRPIYGQVRDWLPRSEWSQVTNLEEFAGAFVFDTWTCNLDYRQAVYRRRSRQRHYEAMLIDHGMCFGGGEEKFVDGIVTRSPMCDAGCMAVSRLRKLDELEPWLFRVQQFDDTTLWDCASGAPPYWAGGSCDDLARLVEILSKRRSNIRSLVATAVERLKEAPWPRRCVACVANDSALLIRSGQDSRPRQRVAA